jgi:hypothetical protein
MGFLKSVASWPVGWIAHKSAGESAHGGERWVLQREIRVGGGCSQGWGKASIATAPTKICMTHTETSKIGTVSKTAWRFGPEDLVKTKFIIIVHKKSINRVFQLLEKFKIASSEAELQLPKLRLKSQNHTSLNRSFLESTFKMLHLLFQAKKC